MHTHTGRLFAIALLTFAPLSLLAQQEHISDIRPLLKSLSLEQKLQVLNYLRYRGADIDKEVQQSYERVSPSNQANTVSYIELMKTDREQLPPAQVEWNRDTIFFEKVPEGTPVIDSFTVRNTGTKPYLIFDTRTTCDCTVLKYPDYPVMPGETAVFRVEFDSRGKKGTATPAIIIYDNSWPNKRTILYLKGDVAPRKKPRKNPWED